MSKHTNGMIVSRLYAAGHLRFVQHCSSRKEYPGWEMWFEWHCSHVMRAVVNRVIINGSFDQYSELK